MGPSATSATWDLADARLDRLPRRLPTGTSRLPESFPADDADLPDLLADPPGAARIAYHPRESFADRAEWSDERVYFLGVDGRWRSLEMLDLGLPESTHPGPDTYGAGALSPDGTRWVSKTNAGIVLLDLTTSRSQVVPLPGRYTAYVAWRPDGRELAVVRYGGGSRTRTHLLDVNTLVARQVSYRLPIDGYASDGTVVTFSRPAAETIRTVHQGLVSVDDVVPVPYGDARYGAAVGPSRVLIGQQRGLVVADRAMTVPVARLRLGRRDEVGYPRGWLDDDTAYFYDGVRGLVAWDVVTGELTSLVRPTPPVAAETYWSTSVAGALIR